MQMRKLRTDPHHGDQLIGIAPIYKVRLNGTAELIGTGFWVTERGHFVTAWHVINENIGADGVDEGPIYAICMTPDRRHIPRTLRKTCKHPSFDLALSETLGPDDAPEEILTWPLPLTLHEPVVGRASIDSRIRV